VFGPRFAAAHPRFTAALTATSCPRKNPWLWDLFTCARESDAAVVRQCLMSTKMDFDGNRSTKRRYRSDASILADGKVTVIVGWRQHKVLHRCGSTRFLERLRFVAIEPEPGNAADMKANIGPSQHISVLEAAIALDLAMSR